MPRPSSSLATLRPDLAGSLLAFDVQADQAGFVGLEVMPVLEVARQAGTFGKIEIAGMLQSRSTNRAPGTAYRRGITEFTTDTYACEEHGFEEPVDDREAAMYADYFDAELMAAMRARDAVLRNFEIRVAALAHAISATSAAGTVWSSTASATPIANIAAAIKVVRDASGLVPNLLVLTFDAWQNMRDCAEVLDRIKYAGFDDPKKAALNTTVLAQAAGIERIVVAGAMKNTANQADAASLANIWTNTEAVLLRVPKTRDIREACWGRTLHWGEDGSVIGGLVETYRDETVRADIVRCRMDTDEKVLLTGAAVRITGVRSS